MSFLKFQSQQGTSLSADNDLMDFEIPSYLGGVDLEHSYLNVMCEVVAVAAATGAGAEPTIPAGGVIYNVGSNIAEDDNLVYNTGLIRNVSLDSQNYGQLESIRRCDVINNTLKHYSSDWGDVLGGGYENVAQTPSVAFHKGSIFRNLVGDGAVASTNVISPISIPLKNLLGMGNMTVDLSKLGSLRLHCQANLNTLIENGAEIIEQTYADQKWTDDYVSTEQTVIGTYDYLDFAYNRQDTANLRSNTPNDIPFWNNQRVRMLIFNVNGGADPTLPGGGVWVNNVEYVITSIERTARVGAQALAAGTYRVYFAQNIYTTAAVAGTSMRVESVAADSLTLSVVQAEIVVKKTAPPQNMGGISYITFKTLQDTTPAATNFSSVYSLDSRALAQMTCFISNAVPFSRSATVLNYRLRVNGDDITNRNVIVNQAGAEVFRSPIHYGLLDRALQRMDRSLKNLTEAPVNVAVDTTQEDLITGPTATHAVLALACSLPADGGNQLLEINFENTGAQSHNLAIYQAIRREIRY